MTCPVLGVNLSAQYILRRLAIDKATVSAVAHELGRCWDTVNSIAVDATRELLLTVGPEGHRASRAEAR